MRSVTPEIVDDVAREFRLDVVGSAWVERDQEVNGAEIRQRAEEPCSELYAVATKAPGTRRQSCVYPYARRAYHEPYI